MNNIISSREVTSSLESFDILSPIQINWSSKAAKIEIVQRTITATLLLISCYTSKVFFREESTFNII